jgi:AcrR family transcriptional regulator
MEPVSPKAQKMARVAEGTLKIIHQFGLPGLTHARLARAAGVSRPWVYAYVGKTKQDLVNLAVDHFAKIYAQLDRPSVGLDAPTWIQGQIGGLRNSLKRVRQYPWIMPIYYRYRPTDTELGRAIQEAERLFIKKQVQELQTSFKISAKKARAITEINTAFKLGIAYRWCVAMQDSGMTEDHVIVLARAWLKRMVKETKA